MKKAPAHEIIKELRQNKGISQKDLADKVGLTQQAIALLENGKRKLEFELFIEILNAIGTTPNELKNIINSIFPRISLDESKEVEQIISELEKDDTSMLDIEILQNFQKLNNPGKKEAAKRVQELTEIPRYTVKEEPPAE